MVVRDVSGDVWVRVGRRAYGGYGVVALAQCLESVRAGALSGLAYV